MDRYPRTPAGDFRLAKEIARGEWPNEVRPNHARRAALAAEADERKAHWLYLICPRISDLTGWSVLLDTSRKYGLHLRVRIGLARTERVRLYTIESLPHIAEAVAEYLQQQYGGAQ